MSEPTVHHGGCVTVMASMPEVSVDAIVCDPPYELGFMGKCWDSTGVAYDPETWRAALRVLKWVRASTFEPGYYQPTQPPCTCGAGLLRLMAGGR